MEHANFRMIPVEIGSANFGMNETVLAVKTRCRNPDKFETGDIFGLKKFRIEQIVE